MKTFATTVILSLAALGAGSAYASTNTEPNNVPFQGVYGTKSDGPTRAQVQAELAAAKAAGKVSNVEPNATPYMGKSRPM
ncbi:hypothetical protein LMG3431_04993 [Achromobacter pestifer]|uniref:DUF4148 domain-containing protein n=1 Tax=Achromobacter pestifer TaxID=1353889 RepID=A0A6S6ZRU1_9BURK|nr:DUF4148 domain-containing protein [Achromobacter pestifer]CAB3693339.1 hypothetical protein LMG3431_04993 [Achromobacter pestifer]